MEKPCWKYQSFSAWAAVMAGHGACIWSSCEGKWGWKTAFGFSRKLLRLLLSCFIRWYSEGMGYSVLGFQLYQSDKSFSQVLTPASKSVSINFNGAVFSLAKRSLLKQWPILFTLLRLGHACFFNEIDISGESINQKHGCEMCDRLQSFPGVTDLLSWNLVQESMSLLLQWHTTWSFPAGSNVCMTRSRTCPWRVRGVCSWSGCWVTSCFFQGLWHEENWSAQIAHSQ